jgi:rubrerythrin
MSESDPLDILKSAILLEKRGHAFYQKVADSSESESVKEFFEMMAAEEVKHIQVLSDQYKSYQETGKFSPGNLRRGETEGVAATVLTESLKSQISGAGFEAAAVAAAMSMEERAIRLYSERAKESGDTEEKALYRWLADWETDHLHILSEIDRDITEKAWTDSGFWPF